jgi:hypothetical protein
MTNCLTTNFVDLASYDEAERYMYNGDDAYSLFVLDTRKSTWFTIGSTPLMSTGNTFDFGRTVEANITRASDYLLRAWLRVITPQVTLNTGVANDRLRWTRNLMHNLVEKVEITFNDLCAQTFTNYHLDFWSAFTVNASKRSGYDNMIGNIDELITPVSTGVSLPSRALNLPLPLFFERDTGISLPTAALPYNEMRIRITLRNWSDLLILESVDGNGGALADGYRYPRGTITLGTTVAETSLALGSSSAVWATYATVSNGERKKMGCTSRNILIEQVQTTGTTGWTPTTSASRVDLRYSHAVRCIFYAARNVTHPNEWSNYTTSSPAYSGTTLQLNVPGNTFDPINTVTLRYEGQPRYQDLPSDISSLIIPFYFAGAIPEETGYHMITYSVDILDVNPNGSTNYGKLTNVALDVVGSANAIASSAGGGALTSGVFAPQIFELVTTEVNHNIVRISGGALGFPVL